MPTDQPREPEPFQPVAALLAAIFPGLGHLYLGHTRRAVHICAGILFLFLGGLLVGGISSVDRREDFIWFLGQALNGPIAFAVDAVHQERFKVVEPGPANTGTLRSARPNEYRDPATARPIPINIDSQNQSWVTLSDGTRIQPAYPPYIKGVGRMRELGTLFTTISGFMNLICIIDAAFNVRRRPQGAAR